MTGTISMGARREVLAGGAIKNALKALWEASDRVCGKRLVVMMIPTLLPVLETAWPAAAGQG